jgi:uncharacterized protein YktA (UPF0223 family)
MSKMKTTFHEEIENQFDKSILDKDYLHRVWKEEQAILAKAEEASFFRTFELTGHYPF